MYLTNDIKLIAYDFDGVMTNNKVILSEDGKESVTVNRGDGFAVKMISSMLRIKQVIISTEQNPIVSLRAKKLGIDVIQCVDDKKYTIEEYCVRNHISLKDVLFVGNDLNDYEAMKVTGFNACPSDAEPEILEFAGLVFNKKGGCGVVRELFQYLLNIKDYGAKQ
ncbi:MAG: HAD hydrolase family protein [Clostridiales bacterium]|jgi:YrbI family 3-deoxy-D-manno-octulosonate 8-phosphate phosphatase|nr:HAD hydrolase family protein [Clostridiales bacterium]